MKVTLCFVPPGGGEADYGLDFDMPGVPQPGDYISVRRPDQSGTEDFIVRRTWWHLETTAGLQSTSQNVVEGKTAGATVECEFALGPFSSENHKRASEMYRNRGKKLQEFDDTCY